MQSNSLYTDAQWEWIAKRYLEGHRIAEIARFLGVHPNTVARHLDQVGADRMLVPLEARKQEFVELGKEA